jgi:deoxyribose-phosphate aldolase
MFVCLKPDTDMSLPVDLHGIIQLMDANECSLYMQQLFGLLDLTSLDGADHAQSIDRLCDKALGFVEEFGERGKVAAVCVYPVFAGQVRRRLQGSGIRTAVVAGAFPSGQMELNLRVEECKMALEEGAEEIDMVISRGRFLAGDEGFVRDEVAQFAELCQGNAVLKVILEVCELGTEQAIRRASRIAMEGGADFIKTSTGKGVHGATPESFYWMLDEVKTYFHETGRRIGIKAAGGISIPEEALQYFLLTREVAGTDWHTPEYLRIGASRLADALAVQLR